MTQAATSRNAAGKFGGSVYRGTFEDLDKKQRETAFYQYKQDTGDHCSYKEFVNAVADGIDWDTRTGKPWGTNPSQHSGWFDRCVSGVSRSSGVSDPEAVCGAVLKHKRSGNPKSPSLMSAGELNKALDKVDALVSKLTQEFIDAGRGHERPSEYLKMNDPLANRAKDLFNQRSALAMERDMRYGPGAPSRLPSGRGFGPRKQNPSPGLGLPLPRIDQLPIKKFYEFGYAAGEQDRRSGDVGLSIDPMQESYKRFDFIWGRAIDNGEVRVKNRQAFMNKFLTGYNDAYSRRSRRKQNPESSAESMYSSFHGTPSTETLEYEQDLHYHGNLAALGELVELKVTLLSGDKAVLTFDQSNGQSSANPLHPKLSSSYDYGRGTGFFGSGSIKDKLSGLKPGDAVKVVTGGERFWVLLTKVDGSKLTGTVNNHLVNTSEHGLKFGSKIQFSKSNVADVWKKNSAEKSNPANNPFWPFSSHSRTVIYHIGSGDEYKLSGTHKGLNIYKEPTGGFAVPKLDAESRFDSKKDAERFIDSWKKARPNPHKQYAIRQERKNDWRVYSITPSGSWGEAVSLHETKAQAKAAMNRLQKDNPSVGDLHTYHEIGYYETVPYSEKHPSGGRYVKLENIHGMNDRDAWARARKLAKERDGSVVLVGGGHPITVSKHATNPKHTTGPFHESGKLLGKLTGAASGPMDQFTDVAGKVGGYLDSRIGRVLNPGVDKNGFSDAHIAGQRWLWAKLKTAKGSFNSATAPDGYLKKLGLESTRHMSAAYQNEATKERILRAQQIYKDFMEGVDYAWEKHYKDQHPSSDNPRSNPEVPSNSSVMLTSNEKGTQLYLVGGDQSINLSDLNIKGHEAEKESVVIGEVTHVVYRTSKDWQDGKSIEHSDYIHKMGEETGIRPTLRYDRLNKLLFIDGGAYRIEKPMMGTSPGLEN